MTEVTELVRLPRDTDDANCNGDFVLIQHFYELVYSKMNTVTYTNGIHLMGDQSSIYMYIIEKLFSSIPNVLIGKIAYLLIKTNGSNNFY